MIGAFDALAIVAIALPLVLAAAIAVPIVRPLALRVAPWAMLPALAVAFGSSGSRFVHVDALLFGTSLGAGGVVTRTFLVLTASVWLASGLFARVYMASDRRCARFWMFFLLTAAGNVGLVLAQDVASFYLFFGLMTFAAYGLVVHEQTSQARRAGRVYLVMALLGEMLLLGAFVMLVGDDINLLIREVPGVVAASPDRDLVVALLLAGFGVKAGALVLHVWLPLAHPVAPTPASAVLSGAMINAGLLGWMRFLPLGLVALPDAGLVCLVAGFTAAFYAIGVGLAQQDPKTILAYSSVSQMGFITAALGVALAEPDVSKGALSAILFYALHHALAKAALFLGTGIASATRPGWQHALVMVGLLVAALDLAGAPLSSGALAKVSLKHLIVERGGVFGVLLSVGAVGSTLLMIKLLAVVAPRRGTTSPRPGLWAPWLVLLVLDVWFMLSPPFDHEQLELLVDPANVVSAAWPVVVAAGIAEVARRVLHGRVARVGPRIPPGDLLVLFEHAEIWLRRQLAAFVLAITRAHARLRAWASRTARIERRRGALMRWAMQLEHRMSTFTLTGAALLLLGILLAAVADR